MTKNRAKFTWLFIPLTIYLGLMAILFVERSGITYQVPEPSMQFLEDTALPLETVPVNPAVESLILYNADRADEQMISQALEETLASMRVRYDRVDITTQAAVDFSKYKTVVLAFDELTRFNQLHELVDWVEKGGRVLIATPPDRTDTSTSIFHQIGIKSAAEQSIDFYGLAFVSDLLPGSQGMRLEGSGIFLASYSIPVQLEADARVHITSGDDKDIPLLWEKDFGQGRFVVINTQLFSFPVNRGIMGAAYTLLQDAFVYPVINSSVYFIDDFPAPIPGGTNPAVTKEFQRDIRGFLMNNWWPDVWELSEKYGIKYTGLLVESYNDKVNPPFDQDVAVDDHRYLGRVLIKNGGEIGLHGYNHIPLCLEKDGINQLYEYPTWPSEKEAQMAIKVLDSLGRTLFPGQKLTVYVPPSNVLCPEARAWLPKVLPELKVISSLLLEEQDQGTHKQSFKEAEDGIIEFPRIVSGYQLYEDGQLARLNELGLHYVNSHFIHPDDILDPERREDRTWAQMRDQFENEVQWVVENAPGIRPMTVSEGAMATQRFYRLKVSTALEAESYTIQLGSFYDEASLMLRTSREPVGITGGTITKVTSTLYLIQANQPEIIVQFRK